MSDALQRMRLRSRDGVRQSLSDRLACHRRQAQNVSDTSQRDLVSSRVAFLSSILDSFDQCDDELEQLAQSFLISQVIQDQGKTAQRLLEEMSALAKTMQRAPDMRLKSMGATLGVAVLSLDRAVEWALDIYPTSPLAVKVGAVPFLKCCRIVIGAWLLGSQLQDRQDTDSITHLSADQSQLGIAAFYFSQVLPIATGLSQVVRLGEGVVQAINDGLND